MSEQLTKLQHINIYFEKWKYQRLSSGMNMNGMFFELSLFSSYSLFSRKCGFITHLVLPLTFGFMIELTKYMKFSIIFEIIIKNEM